jgi:SAM-dependent methyltransferase
VVDSVAAFTMLHHIPTRPLQARMLSEAIRVLRPGGVLLGSDSLHSDELRRFHHGDTYNPIEPATLLALLGAHGYVRITIDVSDRLTFVAHKSHLQSTPPRGQAVTMQPDLIGALVAERQRSLLDDAQRVSLVRRDPRPSGWASARRRSLTLARLRMALRHPVLP